MLAPVDRESDMKSVLRIAAAASLLASAELAHAGETLNLGTFTGVTTASGANPISRNITGQLVGSGYTRVRLSIDWGGSTNDAWSREAIWALTNQGLPLGGSTRFFADPGAAVNATGDAVPRTLNWTAYLGDRVGNSTPLWFLGIQTFAGSTATWSDVQATFDTVSAPVPTGVLDLGVVGNQSTNFNANTLASSWDTELGLFQAWGGRIATNDDAAGNVLQSQLSGFTLAAGTYFLSVSGYDTLFDDSGFGVFPAADSEGGAVIGAVNGVPLPAASVAQGGVQWYSFTIVPAPGAAGLAALPGLSIVCRRRRAVRANGDGR
ncbi:MAG: hypothetical protein IBJ11_01235 [Phycisphaerales bacterium]|nr:hypothetical protein [Phycisphaerales bacterium]